MTLLAGFGHTDEAGGAVSGVIAAGILPAAIEMMDAVTIEAAEAAVDANYPEDCGAVLIVELDGRGRAGRGRPRARRGDLPRARRAGDPDRLRPGGPLRRLAGAEGRVRGDGPDQPRLLRPGRRRAADEAAGVLRAIDELSRTHGLRVGNVFHAGDGNLHPLVLYDGRVEGEAARAEALSKQILEICVDAGGSITGEHGVGTDKACAMPLMFSEDDLAAMQRLRQGVRPARAREPGQALPDAAPVRRGAGAVPDAPAREGRACRPLLTPRILEHEPGDLTCIVEAGIRLSALRDALAVHGQRLSLDPPGDPTLAECLLDDLSGPLSHRFGTMRDLVIGDHGRAARRDCGRARAARS